MFPFQAKVSFSVAFFPISHVRHEKFLNQAQRLWKFLDNTFMREFSCYASRWSRIFSASVILNVFGQCTVSVNCDEIYLLIQLSPKIFTWWARNRPVYLIELCQCLYVHIIINPRMNPSHQIPLAWKTFFIKNYYFVCFMCSVRNDIIWLFNPRRIELRDVVS